jgi:hypothetical protein
MKSLKLIIVIFFILFSTKIFSQDKKQDARNNLMGYGLSYCLNKYGSGSLKKEASQALGGYFELGTHDNEIAYKNVRKFFTERMESLSGVYKESNERAVLMQCIAVYQSRDFIETIRKYDKYIQL